MRTIATREPMEGYRRRGNEKKFPDHFVEDFPDNRSGRWIRQSRGSTLGDLTAFVGGLMMPFAFAPFGFYGLTIVGLALFFRVLMRVTPARSFWRGWVFGVAMFGTGVFWIHESFRFADVTLPLALLLTSALIGVLALYPALFGLFAALWSRRSAVMAQESPSSALAHTFFTALLILPAGWILQEWVRGWFLSGFPWLQIGYAHTDSSLAGLAPLFGVYGVGWVASVSAGVLLLVFQLIMQNESAIRKRVIRVLALLVLTGGLWGGSAWLDPEIGVSPVGAPIDVALIQGNIPQDRKWLPSQRQSTLDRYLSMTREQTGSHLVVWPETALPGFYYQFADFTARLRWDTYTGGPDILLGVPTLDGESQRYFNSVAAISGAGETFYHKRHLVPFGEYLPMSGILQGMLDFLDIPMSDFSPGPPVQAPFRVAGQIVAASVCYEASFGNKIIASLPQATLLVNVSNEAWFGDSLGPHQNLQMARMRARESGRYLLRATNTGITAIIDPQGRVTGRAPQFQVSALTGTVTGMRGTTPYARHGNRIVLSALLIVLLIGVFARSNHYRQMWQGP
uniref:Apolipoprotein N-acyltransferase n=1 Tax=Candidatus Kentrum sp. TC TaxID=2126339 RepID=A0A450YZN6_9GAMM|nr:MAG: apolipoprotein N-acyltransferase [Candidatus Kentron sp. TC]VFK60011.1 MAG: apolipoprotein N-acyltransferase [Candidatus Kentron sp. TC]